MDVPTAFLHSRRNDKLPPVYMILGPEVAEVLVDKFSEMKLYLRHDGSMLVSVDGGIYGLVESANLWNREVTAHLLEDKMLKQSKIDPCLFTSLNVVVTLYVDDLLVAGTEENVLMVYNKLCAKYGKCKFNAGPKVPFLGMTFDFSTKEQLRVSMDMPSVVHTMDKTSDSPASLNLFQVEKQQPLLEKNHAEVFHSIVAKLLYVTNRVRPDIMLAINFLCSRIGNVTMEDEMKLKRVLRYLQATLDHELVLKIDVNERGEIPINVYIDASYATHSDCKSHSGVFITIGEGPILAKSSKQKCVSKSSTEAELADSR